MKDDVFTPAKVCEVFGISKSTLFRWEREGKIEAPARDRLGQRQYSQAHMSEIGKLLYSKLYEQAARAESEPGARERLNSLQEEIALAKFVYFGDIVGLYELAERETLAHTTIQKLLGEAARREPSDDTFRLIVSEIICRQFAAPA